MKGFAILSLVFCLIINKNTHPKAFSKKYVLWCWIRQFSFFSYNMLNTFKQCPWIQGSSKISKSMKTILLHSGRITFETHIKQTFCWINQMTHYFPNIITRLFIHICASSFFFHVFKKMFSSIVFSRPFPIWHHHWQFQHLSKLVVF